MILKASHPLHGFSNETQLVAPAKAGAQYAVSYRWAAEYWTPAFAGVTTVGCGAKSDGLKGTS